MRGMTVVKSLSCAAKLKAGQNCSMSEMAAALDTLAWAYKKAEKANKKHKAFLKKDMKKRGREFKRDVTRNRYK